MAKYTEDYIIIKIANCKKLIETATSDAQRKVYEGYLEFWIKKGVSKEDVVEDTSEVKIKEPIDRVVEFKLEFPGKKAYYTRDGKKYKTKAYKEFLIK